MVIYVYKTEHQLHVTRQTYITMKKYIIPAINVAEIVNDSLLTGSLNDEVGNGVQLAKRRTQRLSSKSKSASYDDDEYEYDFE